MPLSRAEEDDRPAQTPDADRMAQRCFVDRHATGSSPTATSTTAAADTNEKRADYVELGVTETRAL